MWEKGWRDTQWSNLNRQWDLIIIGGGITGAGILREASRAGLKALLVEAHDFSSGTSSRSSKLVHGGFRYLQNAQVKLTLESVHERERLLKEGRGLINPLGFLLVNYSYDKQPPWLFGLGLILYDLLAFQWGHRRYDAYDIKGLCPEINEKNLLGGFRFFDAQADDARLVLRLIQESVRDGGAALNYARVSQLLRSRRNSQPDQVQGIVLRDEAPGKENRTIEVQAQAVINATGAWADDLRQQVGGKQRLRRLRGSHLVVPYSRLPINRAVSFMHPQDGRFVFAYPWEGAVIVGTTDVDHQTPLTTDIAISSQEYEYLMTAVRNKFPQQEITSRDILATYSGVRPVVNTGKRDPSKESREHVLWCENGLLTVTGGKLTTFRLMAIDALRTACTQISNGLKFDPDQRVLNETPREDTWEVSNQELNRTDRMRILGRYGNAAAGLISSALPNELKPVADTPTLWAELRWAARKEGVVHLDDLLLRRTRLGLLLPDGGVDLMERFRRVIQAELGWEDNRWAQEAKRYETIWNNYYSLPH
jgi:glycerol-3-phosphate dehydrogenase